MNATKKAALLPVFAGNRQWHADCEQSTVRRLCFILLVAIITVLRTQGARIIAEFPFELREGLLWIEVEDGPSGERLNFLLDTGAGVSVVNLSTAKRLGWKLGEKVRVQGVHSTVTGFKQRYLGLAIGRVALPSTCLALDLGKLSRSCARSVEGLLGADFFRGRIVQIDFETSKIHILDSVEAGAIVEDIPIELRSCGMRVPVEVNGKRQLMRLDTGCATPLQWVTQRVPEKCAQQIAIGLTELSIPQTTTTVRIGAEEFDHVPTGLHKRAIFAGEAGLLGNGLLSCFSRVTIDAINGRLILRERRSGR